MEKPLQLIEVDRSPSPVPDPSRPTRSLLADLFGPSLTVSLWRASLVVKGEQNTEVTSGHSLCISDNRPS
jgi:hypothetical protein